MTGTTGTVVIELLLNKGVQQEQIIYLSLFAAEKGIIKICGKYPRLKLITSEIDTEQDGVVPGLGQFGDRYFGTCPIDPIERALHNTRQNASRQSIFPQLSPKNSDSPSHLQRIIIPETSPKIKFASPRSNG
jgi:hypothetical protein